mgnify:FL=1
MGILANTKQFLSGKAISAAKKMGDGISTLSALSPKQLQEVETKRNEYLREKPDMSGEETKEVIQKNMGAIGIEVYQAYLEQLSSIYAPVDIIQESFDEDNRIRFFDITKWVTDSEEQSLDKLINVYHVLSEEECNIALIYHRTKAECRVTIGVVNTDERQSEPAIVDKYYSRLIGAIKGNFPGADIKGLNSKYRDYGVGIPEVLQNIIATQDDGRVKSIAAVSNVASEKSEEFISQSMEKLLDGIIPENDAQAYTIVLLAKPIKKQLENKNRLYELYTSLAPYESWQTGYTYTESDGIQSSANFGVNLGVSAGTHSIVNTTTGTNTAIAKSKNHSDTGGVSAKFSAFGIKAGTNYSHTYGRGTTNTEGTSNSTGISAGYNASANFGVSFSRSSSVTANIGKNENISQTYTNYGVKHTLEIIDAQLKRIEESSALGMWEFAAYIISESPIIANNVAHMYLALTQGEESYLTKAAVNFWDGDINPKITKTILSGVQRLQHPVLGLKNSLEDNWLMYPTLVTPTTPLSGKELAKALNFPRKSVSGIPVLEVVSFGREPHSLLENTWDLDLGCGYHMRKKISEQRILLSKEELTKHTFITGSTGSGKSNTIYRLLEQLGREKVNFLVIEPAKGEYKDVIGRKKGVVTFGTNPNNATPMLCINPFSFPKSIHILEHLDRLVEIFNVCWPMYAAMPAILKDAVERAYICAGWNLEKSVNKYDDKLFPTFKDVVKQIKIVLDESDYSADNKGDYTGSLVTRLKSLTNGINGLIFTNDEISNQELFDQNVIVDLSRIGATETKSLIMGLLVLKLQEYRMEQRENGFNANERLKHITVLEEAHNLLKRTSMSQSGEGSNMIAKSVEMLANSIAEMRTYGEGFIIADQSPGLLDMSVIRNTNTKIILRLPDFSDRELVGKSAGLTDNQIIELAKLEKGVAAISQSDWLEPVLCKIDKYQRERDSFAECSVRQLRNKVNSDIVKKSLLDCIMQKEIYRKGDRVDINKLKEAVIKSNLDVVVKCDFIEYITTEKEKAVETLRSLIYSFFDAGKAIDKSKGCKDIVEWVHAVAENLSPTITGYSNRQIDLVMALLIYEQSIRDASYNKILCSFTELFREGGVY